MVLIKREWQVNKERAGAQEAPRASACVGANTFSYNEPTPSGVTRRGVWFSLSYSLASLLSPSCCHPPGASKAVIWGRGLLLKTPPPLAELRQPSGSATNHPSCLNSRHLSCLNSRHLSCLSSRLWADLGPTFGPSSSHTCLAPSSHICGRMAPMWDDIIPLWVIIPH